MASKASSNRRFWRLNNFIGGVNTVLEQNAFTTLDPNAKLGRGFIQVPFQFKRIENFKPNNYGGLSKTHGYVLFKDTTSNSKINGLYRYIKSNGVSQFIFATSTYVKKIVSGTISNLGAGMTVADNYISFETAYDKMVVCDGTNQPQTYDGTTVANLAILASMTNAAGAAQALFHQQRLFLFSNTHDQSLVYYSNGGDITAGYDANFIQCNINDGQKITGMGRFFIPGTLESVIIVSKERSTGVIVGDGTSTNPYTYLPIDNSAGAFGIRQIVQAGSDVHIFTNQGDLSYQAATTADTNFTRGFVSEDIRNQFTNLQQTYLKNALIWLDWVSSRVSIAMPTGNKQYPDVIWHYDLRLKSWYSQTGFQTTSALTDTDGIVYTGTPDGKILQHGLTYNSYAGSPIIGTVETPYLDFFEPHYRKRFVDAKAIVRGAGSYNVGVGTSFNYGTLPGQPYTVPLKGGDAVWGKFIWGAFIWGAVPLITHKFFPSGIFYNVSFTITQAGTDQPVDLLEMMIETETLGIY